MENVIIIGILAALALACEAWLRRHKARSLEPADKTAPEGALQGRSVKLPDALHTDPLATQWPPTVSLI